MAAYERLEITNQCILFSLKEMISFNPYQPYPNATQYSSVNFTPFILKIIIINLFIYVLSLNPVAACGQKSYKDTKINNSLIFVYPIRATFVFQFRSHLLK